jgi:hypothetical protein
MIRGILSITFSLLLLSLAFSPCFGQKTESDLTAEERAAVEKLSERFIQRLVTTGDIEPLIPEFFSADFLQRLAEEAKHDKNEDDHWFERALALPEPGIKGSVIELAPIGDLRQYYLARFRFMNYAFLVMLNKNAKTISKSADSDEDIDEAIIPASVVSRLEQDPYLKNFYIKKDSPSKPIATVDDLRRVNKTLTEVTETLRAPNHAKQAKLSPEAAKLLAESRQIVSKKFGYPMLGDIEGDHFGLPKGTRLIVAFASVAHMLLIAKIGNEYKIVYAGIGSPD